MVQQGDLLAGKYRVENVLGEGGMGYVVAALHEQLNQRVAVKLLSPLLSENEDSVTRFLREARAAVRIRSEHVARVLDVGELPDGSPYMVMEYLLGRDLAAEISERKQLEVAQAIDYLLQACEAVAEAHSIGLIHRDLKPSNLFLTHRPDGSPLVKVLDFGISKAIVPEEGELELPASLTATHSVLGSPSYMSPEQVRRPKSVDVRTDIWSLGTILYEFLVGEGPFPAESPLAVLAAVVSDPTPSIRQRRPDVPPELEAIVEKCLRKNPADRYRTIAEFAEVLAPFANAASLPSISRISGIIRSSQPSPAPASQPPPSDTTLKSVGGLPEADTEEVRIELSTLPRAPDLASRTQDHWSASQSVDRRFQRRSRIALAALATVLAALGGLYGLLRASSRVPALDPPAAAAAAVVKPDLPNSPSPVPKVIPGGAAAPSEPSALPVASSAAPAERTVPSSPPRLSQPKAARTLSVPLAPAAAHSAAPLPAVGSAAAPRRPSDPLEGRH
jgi:eukaryotic-like serine/threonine-protein kinase